MQINSYKTLEEFFTNSLKTISKNANIFLHLEGKKEPINLWEIGFMISRDLNEAEKGVKDLIEKSIAKPDKLSETLNNSKVGYTNWVPDKIGDDYFSIKSKDSSGNIRILEVKLDEESITKEITNETYTDDELNNFVGKIYNLQKITKIYRRQKYNDKRLFAHTVCKNCGREKSIFLSNLINDPEKYGSCICSDTNIDSKIDNIQKLYNGTKKLSSNTSGYTGVSFIKTYRGEPYNKWRAYIEIDGNRTYLGDFESKIDAIQARKQAGENGIKWYKANKNKLTRDVRRKTKKYKNSKYRDSAKKLTSTTDKIVKKDV